MPKMGHAIVGSSLTFSWLARIAELRVKSRAPRAGCRPRVRSVSLR